MFCMNVIYPTGLVFEIRSLGLYVIKEYLGEHLFTYQSYAPGWEVGQYGAPIVK